jgi:hypothetical protein
MTWTGQSAVNQPIDLFSIACAVFIGEVTIGRLTKESTLHLVPSCRHAIFLNSSRAQGREGALKRGFGLFDETLILAAAEGGVERDQTETDAPVAVGSQIKALDLLC